METTYLLDNYVTTKPGQAYRLFPFGVIIKNGKRREITPEYASRFKLPHFAPPIKLGSHDETTPAGGHMKALEVRADENCTACADGTCKAHGLFVLPEWNDKGGQATTDGAFRYHSPEVLWDDGALENPIDGTAINGPLILGDALLHMPHLGEATALYSIEPTDKENDMENVTVPASLWDKFTAFIDSRLAPPPAPEPVEPVIPDEYKAAVTERDELKAQIADAQKATERKARVEKFGAELGETKADPTMADLLADLEPEKAEAIMRQFKSLSEQIKEPEITGEIGQEGAGTDEDPKAAFNAIVLATLKDNPKLTNYNAAFEVAKQSNADLFKAAFPK